MAFDGLEKDCQSRLEEVLGVPLVGRWHTDQNGERIRVSNGTVEDAIQILKPFITEEDKEIDQSMRRKRTWHYPIEAVREMIVNAIVHRAGLGLLILRLPAMQIELRSSAPEPCKIQ